MNIAKNMELLFVCAVLLAGATTLATAAAPAFRSAHAARAVAAEPAKMQIVTIRARRLTAAEKAAL